MKMPKMFSKPLRAIACLALVAILGLVLVTGAGAQTQVSGSLPIEPDKGQNPPGDVLNENEIVNVAVYLVNTSTFNGVNADIRVTGTTVINLSCDDSNCSNHFAALVFDDCFEETGVLTCLPNIADPSIVEINYSAPGKLLPAALKTKLVTIVAHVVPGEQILSPASGLFYANGWTGKADLNMFLVASPGTRNNTTGAAPLYYPAFCGDGVVGNTPGETCDPPGQPGPGSANLCRNNCTYCGDGNPDPGEQCDDGNNINGDGCENDCTPTPICGDGIVGNTPGETCDPPASVPTTPSGNTNVCRENCTYCGDGIVNNGEACDDGNNVNFDGCSTSCQTETCSVQVDKEVSCDGGVTWQDVGLVTTDDGEFSCSGVKNGPIQVRYQARNTGSIPVVNCTINESNVAIGGPVNMGTIPSLTTTPFTLRNPVCSDALSASEPDQATLTCDCAEPGSPLGQRTANDRANIECEPCLVKVDKQISCDNGATWVDQGLMSANEDGNLSCNGIDGAPILVRYQVKNTGNVTLYSCTVNESNSLIGVGPGNIGNIGIGVTTPFSVDDNQVCGDAIKANEPDTATVSCFCTSNLNPDLKASATDAADFVCGTPGVNVQKECKPEAGDTNDVVITVTNTGEVDLANCVVTDKVYLTRPTCPPQPGDVGTLLVISGTISSLSPGSSAELTGTVTGLTGDACNEVEVQCDVTGTGLQTEVVKADDVCESGQGCLTRTPGFWATHPDITMMFLPLDSCGLEVNTTEAMTLVSSTEDMCSVGTDNKTITPPTSPQQIQLVRQCMAANLNIEATNEIGGNCESDYPNITTLINDCCNNAGSICRKGATPSDIDASQCIGNLDAFNNLPDSLTNDLFEHPGSANPDKCKASKNNAWVNTGAGRIYGPKK